ncbi:MAG: hypothetical protein ACRD21_00945 [Vicinamibacteria bacterium]
MTRRVRLLALAVLLGSGVVVPAGASTVKNLSFAERVAQAALIVRGKVVNLEALRRGAAPDARGERREKEATSPRAQAAAEAESLGLAPEAVGVEGGSMIFTRVTLEVEEEIKGVGGRQLVFEIAGGVLGGRAAIVHGMPTFERGQRYLLFLRQGYESSADPIVGVNQGFFEVVRDDFVGADVVLDSNGDFVVAVETDGIRVRRNSARATRPAPQLGAAPVPESGARLTVAGTSPEVLSYWQSSERPMSLQGFRQAIAAAQGVGR